MRSFGRLLQNNIRKLVMSLLVLLAFAGSVSFTFGEAPERTEEKKAPSALLRTEEGLVEIASLEELSAWEEESVSSADVPEEPMVFRDDWSLILINKHHQIPKDYEFELATIKGNIKSDTRVIRHVLRMIRRAEADGVKIYVCSPYRDRERQSMLFDRKMERYMKDGMSEEEAFEAASQTVAIPGTSEHEVGLAFDFITEDYTTLDEGFQDTDAGKWLRENAADYGFILRYPKGKEEITEIEYEPWHYRYVGERAAHEIMDRGITLEEYDMEIGVVEDYR